MNIKVDNESEKTTKDTQHGTTFPKNLNKYGTGTYVFSLL